MHYVIQAEQYSGYVYGIQSSLFLQSYVRMAENLRVV